MTLSAAVTAAAPAGAGARAGLSLALAAVLAAGAWRLSGEAGGSRLALSLVFGALFGFVLQRSRFCFLCVWRDFLDHGDPRGVLGILAALAAGMAGYAVVFGAWLPDPSGTRLPPGAHIGPVGPVLALAGLAFGAGMAVSGSCLSAHLYRLGEGSPTAPFALLGSALGFGLGFLTWNPLYLAGIAEAPVTWLPRHLGYGGSLVAGLAALGGLALWLLRRWPPPPPPSAAVPDPLHAVFVARWPTWLGGLAVGAIGTLAYLRLGPLGVTAELGGRSRQGAAALGLLPERLEGLDGFRGCATALRDGLLTPNGLFVGGLVVASFAAALAAGQFRPTRPSRGHVLRGLTGGLLLGWGAMTGLGCSIGTLLSGIMAGALSGWVFGIAMLVGVTVTLRLGRKLRLLA
ncbi:YeeE/YedE thiosulfate transporter family protein [Methylobacterium indicum]|uniref:YeeE/YedE thiosulfate transporter family protein n=1 Tax=Methylobacterium indicum TaxID=1775910 RepID=UPI002436016C|nr:YeeE/YedE thiosulfate transporter family protein [Methylobacterium indicum]